MFVAFLQSFAIIFPFRYLLEKLQNQIFGLFFFQVQLETLVTASLNVTRANIIYNISTIMAIVR